MVPRSSTSRPMRDLKVLGRSTAAGAAVPSTSSTLRFVAVFPKIGGACYRQRCSIEPGHSDEAEIADRSATRFLWQKAAEATSRHSRPVPAHAAFRLVTRSPKARVLSIEGVVAAPPISR